VGHRLTRAFHLAVDHEHRRPLAQLHITADHGDDADDDDDRKEKKKKKHKRKDKK
jgi:hypothetical protein